jgi:DNA-binding PadR family transcriptional regulator
MFRHGPVTTANAEAAVNRPVARLREVRSVALDGQRVLSARLREVIATRPGAQLDADQLRRDRDAMERALADLGYLAARVEPGRTRPRTVYTLTEQGRRALAEWARTPARFPSLRHEVTVRLLAADLVGEQAVLAGLAGLEAQIDEVEAAFERGIADADTLPHRRKYLLLSALRPAVAAAQPRVAGRATPRARGRRVAPAARARRRSRVATASRSRASATGSRRRAPR